MMNKDNFIIQCKLNKNDEWENPFNLFFLNLKEAEKELETRVLSPGIPYWRLIKRTFIDVELEVRENEN